MATAMPTSTVWNWRSWSPWSETLIFGYRRSAIAAAFTMMSLTETFDLQRLGLLADLRRRVHLHVDGQVEVRNARLHLGHALGDHLAHAGDGKDLRLAPAEHRHRRRCRTRRAGGRLRNGRGLPVEHRRLDVALHDASARTRALAPRRGPAPRSRAIRFASGDARRRRSPPTPGRCLLGATDRHHLRGTARRLAALLGLRHLRRAPVRQRAVRAGFAGAWSGARGRGRGRLAGAAEASTFSPFAPDEGDGRADRRGLALGHGDLQQVRRRRRPRSRGSTCPSRTSAMASPEETLSPSFFSHLMIFPSVIVGESAGIWIAVAIGQVPSSR